MHRIACILTLLASCCWIASCGDPPPDPIAETDGDLTILTCTAFHPNRTVDVTYSDGSCTRYLMPASPLSGQYLLIPGGKTIVSVATGSGAAAMVCDTSNPRGFNEAPDAPCWSGGVNNGSRRIRGPYQDAPVYAYAGASVAITGIVGRSAVINLGQFPNSPYCNSQTALNWHAFGPARNADDGSNSYTANNDPADGPGSALTAAWPDGTTGRPCQSGLTPTGYGQVYYAAVIP